MSVLRVALYANSFYAFITVCVAEVAFYRFCSAGLAPTFNIFRQEVPPRVITQFTIEMNHSKTQSSREFIWFRRLRLTIFGELSLQVAVSTDATFYWSQFVVPPTPCSLFNEDEETNAPTREKCHLR